MKIEGIQKKIKTVLVFGCCSAVGIFVAAYYLLPLTLEIKYFHQGEIGTSQESYWFLGWENFTKEVWNYSSFDTIGIRENRLQLGILELLSIAVGIVVLLYKKITNQKTPVLLWWLVLAMLTLLFLMTSASTFLYQNISILAGIQFPWRFLIVVALIAPFFTAYLLDSSPYKKLFFMVVIAVIGLVRFPQLYGKNYVDFPQSRYEFTTVNPHAVNMNTVWSGKSSDYPVKNNKVEIIEGEGSIKNLHITPTSRRYTLSASTEVRVVDYTYYFPGWTLYLNDAQTEIEYQDPNYRGVMTYRVPAGMYDVLLIYEDTKIRFVAKLISLLCLAVGTTAILGYLNQSNKKKAYIKNALLP